MAVLRATRLRFRHSPGEPETVRGVSFTLRRGQTIGVLGGNECGKTTLAQLLLGTLTPAAGEVELLTPQTQPKAATAEDASYSIPTRALLALSLAIGLGLALVRGPRALAAACDGGAYAVPLLLMVLEAVRWAKARRLASAAASPAPGWAPPAAAAAGVAYISSEHDAGQRLDPSLTIEEAIGSRMPLTDAAARRREVLASLRASGFQMYTDSGKPVGSPESYLADQVTLGCCSGGQRHLIYALAVLATRPAVLIADEMLCGLDIDRQVSMLRMLQRLQASTGLAILYLSVDLAPVALLAHDAAFMERGSWVEVGEAHAMLEEPQSAAARAYVDECRALEARSHGRNLRNAFQTGVSVFEMM